MAKRVTIPPETLNLARRLLAYETVAGENSESATLRVYEKLRRDLCELAGVTGFQLLASRALTLAKSDAPSFSVVQVTSDGRLEGLGDLDLKTHKDQTAEDGAIFIARLLGLLLTFIGEALTTRLMQGMWPDTAFDDMQLGGGRKA
ncbi:MAG: hypothetical protein ROO76_19545 [Terriglobia bacterium]|nr:hypothetical protein [Terriglobia bacterium]